MKVNFISNVLVSKDIDVIRIDEMKMLIKQPDLPKEKLGMFNYWNEVRRSGFSDNAELMKLCVDYDDGIPRAEAQQLLKDYDYIIYNSSSNKCSEGIEKFRVIISLKEPIKASDIRFWRNDDKFKAIFKGCDPSSFAVGRFFYRPSKFDKDRAPVVIGHHSGNPFDFYSMFNHYEKNEKFERIVNNLKFGKPKSLKTSNDYVDKFKERIGFNLHYPDIPSFVLKAKFFEVDFYEAESIFRERYAGNSNWNKNFRECWRLFNPNKTISQK